MVLLRVVGERNDEAFLRQELGSHVRAGVHHGGIDEISVLDRIQQRVADGGFPALASEGAVGVEQQPALDVTRVANVRDWTCRRPP